ncbi:MAG: PEP-utilizing enzyme [Patescibacteria group bacterium]
MLVIRHARSWQKIKFYKPKEKYGESQEIKGQPVYVGKARGKVKIINTQSEMVKMHEGDILVSHMTNPDIVLVMKKACAIITDLGGITSHAAIVARELKKPCVIGTKIATKVLKDEDIVEVDATKGVVKKI